MSLNPGARLGPYEILSPLGAGGMGEVYRARDTRLGRDVAIKIIPDHVAGDPERIARFEREARLLASLRHPNIATLHGLENVDGQRFIVMECIEGETLSHRLASGALPMTEALDVCRQIATALEAAHEGGVIHRDLKPGNVQLTPEGDVRVLDFGLAKANEASTSLSDLSQSPTLSRRDPTNVGVILGTAAYMSPEQARGKPVDRRTDIWSFGAVLYECLTGRQCFAGETLSDTIAMILEREIDWRVLPKNTPLRVRQLLVRCMERDPRKRLRDAGEARIALETAIAGLEKGTEATGEVRGAWMTRARWVQIALGALAGVGLAVVALRVFPGGGGAHTPVVRYPIEAPAGRGMSVQDFLSAALWDVSPDGERVVIHVDAPPGAVTPRLYTRRLSEAEWRPIPGTERAQGFPIFSEDSRTIYFVMRVSDDSPDGRVMRVNMDEEGGAPVAVCDVPEEAAGARLVSRGRAVFVHSDGKQFALREAGAGGAITWKPVERGSFEGLLDPDPFALCPELGANRIFVGTTLYARDGWHRGTAILDIHSGRLTPILQDGQWPAFHPSGVLLFSRGASLMAIRFDRGARRTHGEAVPLVAGLRARGDWLPGRFRLTARGDLVYVAGGAVGELRSLEWMDIHGVWTPFSSVRRAYSGDPSSTSDGKRIAVTVTNARGLDEIWTFDGGDHSGQRAISATGSDVGRPAISRDGRWMAFSRTGYDGRGQLMLSPFGGDEEPRALTKLSGLDSIYRAVDWFPDGRHLLGRVIMPAQSKFVLVDVDPAGSPLRSPRVILPGYNISNFGSISPDGRFLAFDSDRSGREQIYVCGISPDGVTSTPVAITRSGNYPTWSTDGRRVFYADSTVAREVHVTTSGGLAAGADRITASFGENNDLIQGGIVLPDGRALLVLSTREEKRATRLEVVQNWWSSVKGKVPR